MSRSKKKHYQFAKYSESDKKDRSLANRNFRRKSKIQISKDEEPFVHIREVSDTWDFASDGLAHIVHEAFNNHIDNLEFINSLKRK